MRASGWPVISTDTGGVSFSLKVIIMKASIIITFDMGLANMFGKMVEVKLATPKGERDGGGGGGNFQQKHYQKQVMAPSANNTGEFAGLMAIKKYHESRGDG